ncbi:hypothetical protein Anapl_16506, partial [Anas platyrhynchos]
GGSVDWASFISTDSTYTEFGPEVEGQAMASLDDFLSEAHQSLTSLCLQDSACSFCDVSTRTENPAEV